MFYIVFILNLNSLIIIPDRYLIKKIPRKDRSNTALFPTLYPIIFA